MAQLPPDFDFSVIPIEPVSTATAFGALIMYPVLIVFTSIAVALRFLTKIHFFKLGWDDWLMLLAVIFFAVHAGALMSMHVLVFQRTTLTPHIMATFTNLLLVVETFFSWSMLLFKAALGVFFWRLMKEKWQRYTLIFVVSASVIIGIAHFLFMDFMCGIPNQGKPFWKKKLLGECASIPTVLGFGYTHALGNALTDLIVFGLPIPMVWQSRIRRRDKLLISFIFAIAAIGAVAAIVRFFYVKGLGATGPDFWVAVQGLSFVAAIELGLGLTAASLATLRPLFRQIVKTVRSYRSTISSRSAKSSGYQSRSVSKGTPSHSKQTNSNSDYTQSSEGKFGTIKTTRTTHTERGKTFLLSATADESQFRSMHDDEYDDEEMELPNRVPSFSAIRGTQGSASPTALPTYNDSTWPLPVVTHISGGPQKPKSTHSSTRL